MGKTNKVVVCGMKGVGKTSILEQAIYGGVTPDTFMQSTIEDTYCASIETERGSKEKVRFYDTGGRDLSVCHQYLFADGFLLVFNPSKPETLDWLMQAKREIDKSREKKEAVFVVMCNDVGGLDGTVLNRAEVWASREKMKVYQVNSMERTTLLEALVWLTSKMSQPQAKSSFPQLGRKRD